MSLRIADASGSTASRYGSRQTKVTTARRESVCEGRFQDRSRISRFSKTKTIPILTSVVSIFKRGFGVESD